MISMAWSDSNNIIIYRTFEEFKKLHKELKRKFPIESGLLKKSDRTIPKFQAGNLRLRSDRNLSKSMDRLKLLEVYCNELLKAKAKISQGEDVTHFFEAQSRDLDPPFPENSILILPSEMEERKKDTRKPSIPTITQPVVSQSYSCIEAFETKDTTNRPFQATKGETLEVLMKDSTELLYYITQSYEAKNQDEHSVNVGVVVEVLEKSNNGWWLVWYNGSAGYVPSMFLRPYRNPHSKFLALANSRLCISTPNLSEATTLSRKNAPIQQKGNDWEASQLRSSNNLEGGEDAPSSQVRSLSFSEAATIAGSAPALDCDSLFNSSGNVSEERLGWAQKREVQGLGNVLQLPSGNEGSPSSLPESKEWRDSGFDEEPFACAGSSLCFPFDSGCSSGGPTVPPRPSVHEILQKCCTITKMAMQGARPRPTLPGCSLSHC
ncbi:NADPH oxidase organizer 1 isoform X2 [Eublepharis macularius]|uniref:NADPH oxidase organizer 1 isoform X2 n=1 Tax=Eublepharis macularius TaxID=481883 RepID=A0AA97LDH0_EUBMA|nr:NADPH oxidase organizer 1 isoform X2 [Eublepharis macularius]